MASGLDDYLRWQERVEKYRASGLQPKAFCLQEGINARSFYRWRNKLKGGLPEELRAEQAEREKAEASLSLFLPVSLQSGGDGNADWVAIDLPNGSKVRLSVGISRSVLLEVVRVVATADCRRDDS